MISYQGERMDGVCAVSVCGEDPIMMRNLVHIEKHSPDGFNWGYPGSGPAELARCILTDFLGSEHLADRFYQRYKWDVIAPIQHDGPWEIKEEHLISWFKEKFPDQADEILSGREDRREEWLSQY
jgi:hypothetical protein